MTHHIIVQDYGIETMLPKVSTLIKVYSILHIAKYICHLLTHKDLADMC